MNRFDGIDLPSIVQRRFDVRMTESKTKLDVLTARLAKARHIKAFEHLWPSLDNALKPKLAKLRTTLPRHEQKKLEHDRILEELLLLARQQSRVLSNPAGLIGEEVLALLLRLTHEPEGAAIRLVHKERDLVLALCGRWGRLQYELNGYISVLDPKERPHAREMIERFSSYVKELQSILVGTATTQSIQQAFGSSSQIGSS
ncbi:hypothetical protein [Bradyrhizobium sp. USDA 223]|uniref:hypothetical protein n=1 Tax=Bradyrhizobium sp. USDA 223 TaxID=3156306 RepID=UPI0038382951